MVMSFRLSNSALTGVWETLEVKPKGPTYGELAAQAKRALHDSEGVDVTDMSREERAKSFFGE